MNDWDFHCHTSASDGAFSPKLLLERASVRGIKDLAITDHDTVLGFFHAQPTAKKLGINLIPAIELTCQWRGREIHIVGLNISYDKAKNDLSLLRHQETRRKRWFSLIELLAKKLTYITAEELANKIKTDILKRQHRDGTFPIDTENLQLGRLHIANWLVGSGIVSNRDRAFKRYLKPLHNKLPKVQWPSVETVVNWIKLWNGVSVLAHPSRYGFTKTKLGKLLTVFKNAGGQSMELVHCQQKDKEHHDLIKLSLEFELFASGGSDFHNVGFNSELGRFPPLPDCCRAVHQLII